MFTLFVLSVLLVAVVEGAPTGGNKKCETVKWKWPEDFKLLTSKDDLFEFVGYSCYTFRDWNIAQSGKYFCWKKQKALPPITFRGIFEDTKGDACHVMYETMDIPYVPRAFCLDFDTSEKFKFNWHYLTFFGYNQNKCIKFKSLLLDAWMNNYMCGEPMTFESEYCEETEE